MRRRRRTAALVLAAVLSTACSSWHARTAPNASDSAALAHRIRVTRSDRSVVVLDHASVRGDSLIGQHDGSRVAIALGDVQRVDEKRVSAVRTTVLVLVAAFAGILVLAALTVPPNWN